MAERHVRVVAFAVNETFSLDSLSPAFASVGLEPEAVPWWFARLLRDGFALTAMGQYRSFGDLAGQTLRALDPDKIDARHRPPTDAPTASATSTAATASATTNYGV